jgi:type IV secretion system protein VirD4
MFRIIVTCAAGLLALAIGSSYLGGLIGIVERALVAGDAIASGSLASAATGLFMAAALLGVGSMLLGGSLGRGVKWLAVSALLLALAAWAVGYLGAAGPWVLLAIAIFAILTALTSRRGGRGGRSGLVVAVVALVAIGGVGWLLGGEGEMTGSTRSSASQVAVDDGVIDLDAPTQTTSSAVAKPRTNTGVTGQSLPLRKWGLWVLLGVPGGLLAVLLLLMAIGRIPLIGPVIARNIAYPLERAGNRRWIGPVALWTADQIAPARIMQSVIRSPSGAHGNDRLMTDSETKQMWGEGAVDGTGRPAGGLILGKSRDGTILRLDRLGAVLLEARPDAGKTVSVVIPTLLTPARESRVVLDVKGELYAKTAGFRRSLGQRVIVIDPERITSSKRDARINILMAAIPGEGENIAKAATNFMGLLLPRPDASDKNAYFVQNARSLLLGFVVWVRCAPDHLLPVHRSLIGVRELLDSEEGAKEAIERMLGHLDDLPVHARPLVKAMAKFVSLSDQTFSSAPSNASNTLDFLDIPGWRRALCCEEGDAGGEGEEYSITDLFQPGLDVYLTVLPATLKANPGAPRLLIGCALDALIEEGARRGGDGLESKVRFVLDEVAQLGKCEPLVTAVEVGRTVARLLFVVQYFGQLEESYGRNIAATLANSFATKVYLTANDEVAAKRISAETGEMTILDRSTSANRGWSYKEAGRAVLKPGDVLHMDASKLLVITPNRYAAVIDRVRWFEDPRFRDLVRPSEPVDTRAEAAE